MSALSLLVATATAGPPSAELSSTGETSKERIPVNFKNTTIEKYPFAAEISIYNASINKWLHLCTGTIVSKRHILSAAFEFDSTWSKPELFKVVVGTASLKSGGTTFNVTKIYMHPGYVARPNLKLYYKTDMAILELKDELTLGKKVALARLPEQGFKVPNNSTIFSVGWSGLNNLIPTDNLAEWTLRLACAKCNTFPKGKKICGELDEKVTSAYTSPGDRGGPLIYDRMVVGVVSFTVRCGIDDKYTQHAMSTRISHYIDWINDVITRTRTTSHACRDIKISEPESASASPSLQSTALVLLAAVLSAVTI